jgi:hypothetical protein
MMQTLLQGSLPIPAGSAEPSMKELLAYLMYTMFFGCAYCCHCVDVGSTTAGNTDS